MLDHVAMRVTARQRDTQLPSDVADDSIAVTRTDAMLVVMTEDAGPFTELYANAVVIDRITKPELRFPYSAIATARPSSILLPGRDANYPSPRRIPLRQRKNARLRNARERAFHAWCSKLYEVRTYLGSFAQLRDQSGRKLTTGLPPPGAKARIVVSTIKC